MVLNNCWTKMVLNNCLTKMVLNHSSTSVVDEIQEVYRKIGFHTSLSLSKQFSVVCFYIPV